MSQPYPGLLRASCPGANRPSSPPPPHRPCTLPGAWHHSPSPVGRSGGSLQAVFRQGVSWAAGLLAALLILVGGWRFSSWESQHPPAVLPTVPQLPTSQGPVSPHHLNPFPQTPLASHGPELHLCIQGVEIKVLPISHVTPTAPLVPPQWVPNTWACHPSPNSSVSVHPCPLQSPQSVPAA